MPITEKCTPIENEPFSLIKIILTFFSIISVRLFLDNFAYPDADKYFFSMERFIQAPLYFFSIFLSLSILTYLFTKESFKKILPYMTKAFLFILTVPLIDLMLNGVVVEALKYITISSDELIPTFFKIMNPFSGQGITIGQHFAAYGIFISIAFFIYKVTGNFFKTITSMLFGYTLLFLHAILPSIVVAMSSLSKSTGQTSLDLYHLLLNSSWISYSNGNLNLIDKLFFSTGVIHEITMAHIFFILVCLEIAIIFYIANGKIWNAFKNDLRIERIFYWFAIAGIGMVLSQKIFGDINLNNPVNTISFVVFLLLIILNIWLAVFINDTEDTRIDEISNPKRPLAAKLISEHDWKLMQIILLLIIIFGTATMSKPVASLLILSQASYYIYSAKPLRLKRHFIFSSLLTGLAAVAIAMAGFFLVSPDQHITVFPLKAIFIIGIAYGLISNLKDIKDFVGDSHDNIRTIPVIFGLKRSKLIIGIICGAALISVPIILHEYTMIIFSTITSIFLFHLFTKKEYQEKYIFLVFFLYLITLYFVTK